MSASVVIVAYNSGPALVRCLRSLREEGGDHEVVVVNNGPPAPEIDEVSGLPGVRLVEPGENLGYAGAPRLAQSTQPGTCWSS